MGRVLMIASAIAAVLPACCADEDKVSVPNAVAQLEGLLHPLHTEEKLKAFLHGDKFKTTAADKTVEITDDMKTELFQIMEAIGADKGNESLNDLGSKDDAGKIKECGDAADTLGKLTMDPKEFAKLEAEVEAKKEGKEPETPAADTAKAGDETTTPEPAEKPDVKFLAEVMKKRIGIQITEMKRFVTKCVEHAEQLKPEVFKVGKMTDEQANNHLTAHKLLLTTVAEKAAEAGSTEEPCNFWCWFAIIGGCSLTVLVLVGVAVCCCLNSGSKEEQYDEESTEEAEDSYA